MTDAEIKQVMEAIARVSSPRLPAERIEIDLPAYKSYLAALDEIQRVNLPLEAEPNVVLTPPRRR